MIDILIPITEKVDEYEKSLDQFAGDENVNLILGVTRSVSKSINFDYPNMTLQIFQDGSNTEEIINAMQPLLISDQVFVARKPFSKEEFLAFTNADADIVTCAKPKGNVFTRFFAMIWASIVKYVFGVKFFKGDPSLVFFNENCGGLLKEVHNLSYSTRVDRWKGMRQDTALSNSKPIKMGRDAKTEILLILFAVLALAVGVVTTVVVALFAKINVLYVLLLVCLDAVCLSITILLLVTLFFKKRIGKRDYVKAAEV